MDQFLIAVLMIVTGLLPLIASAQTRKRKPVVVSFGQPNIWSSEQAHDLLARMHRTNLELQAKSLTPHELDPNASNETRIQVLKQLLEIGAQFNLPVLTASASIRHRSYLPRTTRTNCQFRADR